MVYFFKITPGARYQEVSQNKTKKTFTPNLANITINAPALQYYFATLPVVSQ